MIITRSSATFLNSSFCLNFGLTDALSSRKKGKSFLYPLFFSNFLNNSLSLSLSDLKSLILIWPKEKTFDFQRFEGKIATVSSLYRILFDSIQRKRKDEDSSKSMKKKKKKQL
jgi:hypothetical protein